MKIRPWLQGSGLAMLYMLPPIADFLSPARRDFYHQLQPVTTLTRGVLLDLLMLGVLCGAGFVWLDRAAPRIKRILWLPVFLVTALIASRDILSWMGDLARAHWLRWLSYLPAYVLMLAVCLLLLVPQVYERVTRALGVVLAAAGLSLVFVVCPRLVLASFGNATPDRAAFVHPVSEAWRPGELRIVWVLFDELSYKQAFADRQPGVELPAFAAFARQSVSYSQLQPIGDRTERIIPALLMGQPVEDVMGDADGGLRWQRSAGAPWQKFDQEATLFAEARRQGWSTGVAGWYNPYCRILDTVLNRCFWTFSESRAGELSSRKSSWQNALVGLPFAAHMEDLSHRGEPNHAHLDDYRSVMREAKALLQDTSIRFAFIHLPVPHPVGIFKKPGVKEADAYDYLGNLLLADHALAELEASVDASPASADTVFIVSSDHSWRIPMWRLLSTFTPAEERAAQGGFDQRPVLMIRYPAEVDIQQPQQIDRPESTMIVHGLISDLIAGKLRLADDSNVAARQSGARLGQK